MNLNTMFKCGYPAATLNAVRARGGAQPKVLMIDKAGSRGFAHGFLFRKGITHANLHPAGVGGYNASQNCNRFDGVAPNGNDPLAGGGNLADGTLYMNRDVAIRALELILDAVQGWEFVLESFVIILIFCVGSFPLQGMLVNGLVAGAARTMPAFRSHDDDHLLFNSFGMPGTVSAKPYTHESQVFLIQLFKGQRVFV